MNNSVINTTFEVSLRAMLTLEAIKGIWHTSDMVAALDFITAYGKEFAVSDENLHGESSYKFSEFALRREMVRDALKLLVVEGLVEVKSASNGFVCRLSTHGIDYCAKLGGDYALSYRSAAQNACAYVQGRSDRQVLAEINNRSVRSLQRGERYD